MSICKTPFYSGLADCKALWSKVVGIGIMDKGTTFTRATFVAPGTWHTAIASATEANRTTMILPVLNYENTSDDPSIQTSNLGVKRKDLDPPPSMQVWLDISPCDYKTLFAHEGIAFEVVLFLQGKKQLGTLTSAGAVKGFRATISLRRNAPPSDNAMSSYPVDIFFDLVDEFEDFYVDDADYGFKTLLDYVPAGLSMYIKTAIVQATGTVVVQVNTRCTNTGKTGLVAADFEIWDSNAEGVVAVQSATDNGGGQYTVVIKEDGGATFIPVGEWYEMYCGDDDATYQTYQSNVVKETVLA